MPGPVRQAIAPLDDDELAELGRRLETVPAPCEPLDVSAIDGLLCGVVLQPEPVPMARWMRLVVDADGRPPPSSWDASRIHGLVARRHAEIGAAVAARRWFDPWVFAVEPDLEAGEDAVMLAVQPWVAGFALAMEAFPGLMRQLDPLASVAPLSLVYRHLDPDDLEDADDLLEEIESLEPCQDLAEAVEGLVRAVLLLADLAGARAAPQRHGRPRR